MQHFFKRNERPEQNDIVLAYFTEETGPEIGKYQDGKVVLSDGKRTRDWNDVAQWRRSDVNDPSSLVTKDKPAG
ncbi:MAG: hypothetical protein J0I77_01870 [Rudaea sp.]|uniref:hypothetical protein n=1 Tax=unclassified Rudaea TaxID=2627037 RepID=UPI0010F85EF5|nr:MULTISPECIES: hypothetical protein [unclassified Rudaea]MBN8884442.1 hypothetical protein [Rudaea sp.]